MKHQDFNIEVDNGVLSVFSEKEEEQDRAGKFARREFSYQSFRRFFTLPEAVKAEQIEAKYEDGILVILSTQVSGSPGAAYQASHHQVKKTLD